MGRRAVDPPTTEYGRLLRERRKARGLTMDALADRADTSNPVVSNLERGKRNPSREMVRRLTIGYAPVGADKETIRDLIDEGLLAAGFTPEGTGYKIVRVLTRQLETDYASILDDLSAAAQAGCLDQEAIRRIRRHIQFETEEAARRLSKGG